MHSVRAKREILRSVKKPSKNLSEKTSPFPDTPLPWHATSLTRPFPYYTFETPPRIDWGRGLPAPPPFLVCVALPPPFWCRWAGQQHIEWRLRLSGPICWRNLTWNAPCHSGLTPCEERSSEIALMASWKQGVGGGGGLNSPHRTYYGTYSLLRKKCWCTH